MNDDKNQNQSRNAREKMDRRTSNSSRVETLINDIDFPCTRDDILTHARNNGASPEVMEILERFPEKQYASTADIARSMGAGL